MRAWLRHAFAIQSPDTFVPTMEEAALVRQLATDVARRQMVLPASVLLESIRPLGYVSAQVLWSTHPWFAPLIDTRGLKVLAGLFERPGAIDYILEQLQVADSAVNVRKSPQDGAPQT